MNKLKLHTHISEIEHEAWENLLDNSPYASFFQSPQCYEFYASLSFMQPFVFAVSEDDVLKGLVCGYIIADGGMIKRYFSRRAIIPGGLLLSEDISDDALTLLLNHTKKELKHKAIYIEIRNYKNYSIFKSVFESVGFAYQPHLNFIIETNDEILVFKNISSSKKRQIKQTLKEGVQIVEAKSKSDVISFYEVLEKLYKEKIKLPLFPESFFCKFIENHVGRIFIIQKDLEVLGGIVCVYDNYAVYEWFVCGEDKKYDRVYPSVLATWAGIKYALDNNYVEFNFMGAGRPDRTYGIREFKSKFGGKQVDQGRFLYLYKPIQYRFTKYILQIIRKMK